MVRVHVVVQNPEDDRILPRMARYLRDRLGWTIGPAPAPRAEAVYLMAYFEGARLLKASAWPEVPVMAYFTHREEEPPGNDKARCYDDMARRVQLRVATCRLYANALRGMGATVQAAAPLERDRFTIARCRSVGKPVVGFSGYTYQNHRKGEDLVTGLLGAPIARRVNWVSCGRGWPVPTQRLAWSQMPGFYQGLDVLVVPSRVEGIPMPPLEALSCGVRVVVPRGVGLLDELPEVEGIYRYPRGDVAGLIAATERAAFPDRTVDREALRAATAVYSVEAWCRDHAQAVAKMVGKR